MKKQEAIDRIVEGHVEDIENWATYDRDSLKAWLLEVLKLKSKTKAQLQKEFSAYLQEDEDEPPEPDWEEVPEERRCPHGNKLGACDRCDYEGDLAYDAQRENERRHG